MSNIYIFFLILPFTIYGQIQIGGDLDGEFNNDGFGNSVSISSGGNIIAVGAEQAFNSSIGGKTGMVKVFENQGGNWGALGNTIYGNMLQGKFGSSVSLSSDGMILAIGAESIENGVVYVYEYLNGDWNQRGSVIPGIFPGDRFGTSVSLSSNGSIVGIGATEASGNGGNEDPRGYAQVYEFQGGDWQQLGGDIEGENWFDSFGKSVSLSSEGNILAVGAPFNNTDGTNNSSGEVKIYEFISNDWVQIGEDIEGESTGDNSGWSVSLSSNGTKIAIGAPKNSFNSSGVNSGHVRVYENQSGEWGRVGQDIDGENEGDESGTSVSLSADGSIVAVGAPENSGVNGGRSGHVRIYKNIGASWAQIGTDIDGESSSDESGLAVALSSGASHVIIGAPENDGDGLFKGHARGYYLSGILSNNNLELTGITIYPNPATSIVNVIIPQGISFRGITFYDNLGRKLLSINERKFDVSKLSKGIYYMEIMTDFGMVIEKMMVMQ